VPPIVIANVHHSSPNSTSIYIRTGQASLTVINVGNNDSTTEDDNCPKCAICKNKIWSSRDEGYADTQNRCTCEHNYHHHCLMQMREHCLTRKKNMQCHKCKQHIFNILDSEKVNTFKMEEHAGPFPNCQERLLTHFELGQFNGCSCTAIYYWKCLQSYRDHWASEQQYGVKYLMCKRLSEGLKGFDVNIIIIFQSTFLFSLMLTFMSTTTLMPLIISLIFLMTLF
jgi:hypothetical protein